MIQQKNQLLNQMKLKRDRKYCLNDSFCGSTFFFKHELTSYSLFTDISRILDTSRKKNNIESDKRVFA